MNKLGFGFLRLPRLDPDDPNSYDLPLLEQLVDRFLAGGGTYFDTAYTYLDGMSERLLRRALVERHPRKNFVLADKLPSWHVKCPEDCQRFFDEQLERCGVDYFDVYLLHWLNPKNYAIAQQFDEFAFLRRVKAQGKAGRIGFSYHGDAALLDAILTAHPEVDLVQLQINYLDWDDPAIEAGKCYEVACRHGKDVIVMEPVKGGTLATLPEEAMALLEQHAPGRSPAAWATKFVQSLPQVKIMLSGMNTLQQIEENLQDVEPISEEEKALLRQVSEMLNASIAIPCTACRYCTRGCPMNIPIPDYFSIYNSYVRHPGDGWKMSPVYANTAKNRGKASDCIGCKACERNCPQRIQITQWLPKIAKAFE